MAMSWSEFLSIPSRLAADGITSIGWSLRNFVDVSSILGKLFTTFPEISVTTDGKTFSFAPDKNITTQNG
jgi:hypothetical protein